MSDGIGLGSLIIFAIILAICLRSCGIGESSFATCLDSCYNERAVNITHNIHNANQDNFRNQVRPYCLNLCVNVEKKGISKNG